MTANRARKADIRAAMASDGVSYTEAAAVVDDPGNKVLCRTCGWIVAMICPECPGCGCYNGKCSGWRHHEYATDEEREERALEGCCPECGSGGPDNPYGEGCEFCE